MAIHRPSIRVNPASCLVYLKTVISVIHKTSEGTHMTHHFFFRTKNDVTTHHYFFKRGQRVHVWVRPYYKYHPPPWKNNRYLPPHWKFLNSSCTYHAFIILHNLFQAVIFCKLMSSESSWFSNKSTEIKFIIFILFKYFLNPYIECGIDVL